MASVKVHEDQAKHNYNFLKSISSEKYCDWKLTVAFYTALHAIDSGLTSKDPLWRDKRAGKTLYSLREQILAMWNRDLYRNYYFLYERSKESRYLELIGDKTADKYFKPEQVDGYIEKYLKPILEYFKIEI